jgi:hypothetical protein
VVGRRPEEEEIAVTSGSLRLVRNILVISQFIRLIDACRPSHNVMNTRRMASESLGVSLRKPTTFSETGYYTWRIEY